MCPATFKSLCTGIPGLQSLQICDIKSLCLSINLLPKCILSWFLVLSPINHLLTHSTDPSMVCSCWLLLLLLFGSFKSSSVGNIWNFILFYEIQITSKYPRNSIYPRERHCAPFSSLRYNIFKSQECLFVIFTRHEPEE